MNLLPKEYRETKQEAGWLLVSFCEENGYRIWEKLYPMQYLSCGNDFECVVIDKINE